MPQIPHMAPDYRHGARALPGGAAWGRIRSAQGRVGAVTDGFRVKEGVPVQRLGAELMVFDAGRDEVHVLNETSAAIWEGVRDGLDVAAIEALLRGRYDLAAVPDPGRMIRAAIAELAAKGILEPVPPDGAPREEGH
jgi:hypothetical protein